jgi:hypothetical protein
VGVQYLTGGGASPIKCSVRASGSEKAPAGAGDPYELTPEQASNAATISAVGIARHMPERAVTIALATAIQESGLRNLRTGDRDSLGLFQQRPSAGWGTKQQVVDPVYASTQFYERLAKIPGYERLPVTEAAQEVQHSGFPEAYAKHEGDAELLAAAFTGMAPAALTCPAPFDHTPGDPAKVRTALTRAFGPGVLPKGGPEPTVQSGTSRPRNPTTAELSKPSGTAGSAGSSGGHVTHAQSVDARAATVLSVPVQASKPKTPNGTDSTESAEGTENRDHGKAAGTTAEERGWELAHWAVARAGSLHIGRNTYDDWVWSAADAGAGWQHTTRTPGAAGGSAGAAAASRVVIGLVR